LKSDLGQYVEREVVRRVIQMRGDLEPEVRALISCAAGSPDGANGLFGTLPGALNWAVLVDLAEREGMLPLLSRTVSQCVPPSLSADVLRGIQIRDAAKAMRSLAMAGELARLLRAFEAAGLTPIAFKGPTLAHLLYGDLTLRDSTDLDIFVPRAQLTSALKILTDDGYYKKTPGNNTWLTGACEVTLRRNNPACEVDLHWQFFPPYFLPPDTARVLERSVMVRADGLTARTLCPEDLLLYLSIDAARDWWPLRSICDIAALTRNGSLNWDDVLRESQHGKCWRAVAVGLRLAASLCEASLPPDVWRRVESDSAAASMAADLASKFRHGDGAPPNVLHGAILQLRAMEGGWGKLRYLWRRTFQPNALDADFLPLPRKLSAAYYVVRPFRGAVLALGAIRRKWFVAK
jgi:hypothetical protein